MASGKHRLQGRVHPSDAQDDAPPLADAAAAPSTTDLSRTASLRSLRSRKSQRSLVRRTSSLRRDADDAAKGLLLPAEEHKAWLAARLRSEGRAAAAALLRFYGRMLLPVAVAAAYTCAIAAGLSYSIPNLLCNRVARENSGAAFGIVQCIYNDIGNEGGYSVRWGAKLFWLVFHSILKGWGVLFSSFIAAAMFGPALILRDRVIVGSLAVLCTLILPITGPRFGMAINHMGLTFGTAPVALLATGVSSLAAKRYTGSGINAVRWFLLFLLGVVIQIAYQLLMPKMITQRSGEALGGLALTAFRVFVHPVIFSQLSAAFRSVLRHLGYVPEMTACVFLSYPAIYAEMYGRFILLQLDNVGSVVIMNILFAVVDLSARLGDRACDGPLLKALYGERGRDALTALREHDDKRMAEVFIQLLMESVSILAASAMLSLGGVAMAPGVPPNHRGIWSNAAIQLATTVVAGFAGLAIEGKAHAFEWQRSYTPRPWRLLGLIMVMLTFGASMLIVDLVSMFCPVYYPDTGKLLLEQCDKPSLFQAITFSSASRFEIVGSALNITQSSVNAL